MPQQNTEKRVKLGVDIGALSTDLVVLNELVKRNSELAKQGQEEYNKILNNSLQLLDTKIEKLQTINGVLQNIIDKGDISVNIKEQVEAQLSQSVQNLQNQQLSNIDLSELTSKGAEIVDSINEIKEFVQSLIDSVIAQGENQQDLKVQIDPTELVNRPEIPENKEDSPTVDLTPLEELVSSLVTLVGEIKEKNFFPEEKIIGALKEIKDKNIRQRNYYPEDKILRILDDLKETKQIGGETVDLTELLNKEDSILLSIEEFKQEILTKFDFLKDAVSEKKDTVQIDNLNIDFSDIISKGTDIENEISEVKGVLSSIVGILENYTNAKTENTQDNSLRDKLGEVKDVIQNSKEVNNQNEILSQKFDELKEIVRNNKEDNQNQIVEQKINELISIIKNFENNDFQDSVLVQKIKELRENITTLKSDDSQNQIVEQKINDLINVINNFENNNQNDTINQKFDELNQSIKNLKEQKQEPIQIQSSQSEDKLIEVISQLSTSIASLQDNREEGNQLLQISGLSEGFDLITNTINNLYQLVELEVDEQISVVQQVLDRLNSQEDTKADKEVVNIDLSELISSNESIIAEIQSTKSDIVGEISNLGGESQISGVDYTSDFDVVENLLNEHISWLEAINTSILNSGQNTVIEGGSGEGLNISNDDALDDDNKGGSNEEALANAAAMVGEFLFDVSDKVIDVLENYGDNIVQELQQMNQGGAGAAPVPVTNDTGEGGEGSSESDDEEGGQQKRGGRGQQAAGVFNQVAGNLMKKSDIYAISAFVSMIPAVGQGLSTILNGLLEAAEDLQKGRAEYVGKTGNIINPGIGGQTHLGLSQADTYRKVAQYIPANIRVRASDLEFEKGWGLSSGTMSSLLSSMREDISQREMGKYNMSSSNIGLRYLNDISGAVGENRRGEIRGYGEEYLKILVQLNQEQLQTTGKTNALLTGQIIEGIMKLSDKFANPQVLQQIVGNIKNGLSQASSPQMEAMQYYTLQEMFPEASLWELEKMREDPFGFLSEEGEKKGKNGKTYFENFLNNLLQTGGNIEDAKWTIRDAFNLSAHQVDQLLEGYLGGQNLKQTAQEVGLMNQQDKSGKTSFERLPAGSVSEFEVHKADWQNTKAEIGQELLPLVYSVEGLVKEVAGYIKDTMETFKNEGFKGGVAKLGLDLFTGALTVATNTLKGFTGALAEASGKHTTIKSQYNSREEELAARQAQQDSIRRSGGRVLNLDESTLNPSWRFGKMDVVYKNGERYPVNYTPEPQKNDTNVPNNPNNEE